MRSSASSQSGFTLTNIIVVIALCSMVFVGWKINVARKAKQETQKKIEAAAERLRNHLQATLKNDLAWKHTLESHLNTHTVCLRDFSSCAGKGGPISVRDHLNRVVYDGTSPMSGFTSEGGLCPFFTEAGSDECPFRMNLRWEPHCIGDCVKPESVIISARLQFRPGPEFSAPLDVTQYGFSFSREAYPSEPRTCLHALENGQDRNGTYSLRPDPKSPPFQVYCDQTRDGGGWALIVNSSSPDIGQLPLAHTVSIDSHARLNPDRVEALLRASQHQNDNNIRLLFPDIDGGVVLGASTNGGTEVVNFKARMPNGDCREVEREAAFATKSPASYLSVELSGKGSAGFLDVTDPVSGYIGFHICLGGTYKNAVCGAGCNRKWTGSLVRQKGTLWLR